MVKVTSLVVKAGSGLRSSFVVRAWTEMEKGMHRLKLVSCENNSGFKGLSRNSSTSYCFDPQVNFQV